MCLTTQCRITRKEGIGYKVMYDCILAKPGYYTSDMFGWRCGTVKKNKWVTDPWEGLIESECGNYYKSGFHVFNCLTAAEWWRLDAETHIVKVKYRDVVAQGRQNGYSVSVARQIRILGRVK